MKAGPIESFLVPPPVLTGSDIYFLPRRVFLVPCLTLSETDCFPQQGHFLTPYVDIEAVYVMAEGKPSPVFHNFEHLTITLSGPSGVVCPTSWRGFTNKRIAGGA